jgi:hypothetical protein
VSLDIVELVIDVEQSFGVELPNDKLEGILTIGDLHRLVVEEIGAGKQGLCLSGVAFYRVRRALMQVTGVSRKDITLARPVEDLMPWRTRRSTWKTFGQALDGLRLEPLARPAAIQMTIMLATSGVGVVYVLLILGRLASAWWWTALPLMAVFAGLAVRTTRPLAVCFPSGCETVRGLVLGLLAHNHRSIATQSNKDCGAGTEGEVWDSLCHLISVNLEVDRECFTENTSFSELGIS